MSNFDCSMLQNQVYQSEQDSACSCGVCYTTISVWFNDDDASSSCAIAAKLSKSNPLGLTANIGSNSNENTTITAVMPFLLSIVTFDIFRQRQTILNCIYDLLNSIREIHSYITCLSDGGSTCSNCNFSCASNPTSRYCFCPATS